MKTADQIAEQIAPGRTFAQMTPEQRKLVLAAINAADPIRVQPINISECEIALSIACNEGRATIDQDEDNE